MSFKNFLLFIILLTTISSCSDDSDISVARNLEEYMNENLNREQATLTAFASNAQANTGLNYILYYPEDGASDIRYYQTTDITADKNDYSNYRRQSLTSEAIFGGKLGRFSRSSDIETWCLVTYITEGKLHISAPIRLKNTSSQTKYTNEVTINFTTSITPKFSWDDIENNITYFQVISDEENNFISGTFTEEKTFQYYDESNVVATINDAAPKDLIEDEIYNFTMMGIDEDNWVNLIIEAQFIPRNLEEYIAANPDKTTDTLLAFAGSGNGNSSLTYTYFYPIEGAFEYRYYETDSINVNQLDYNNYKRKNLTDIAIFNVKLRRFSNESVKEVWCIVTYITEGKLHISEPIKKKNLNRETAWTTQVDINQSETLKPRFTWDDTSFGESVKYLQILSSIDDTFLSGTFTEEKTFQYNNTSNVNSTIHSGTPPDLIFDTEYKFFLFGISSDNWVNLIIQDTFIVQ